MLVHQRFKVKLSGEQVVPVPVRIDSAALGDLTLYKRL